MDKGSIPVTKGRNNMTMKDNIKKGSSNNNWNLMVMVVSMTYFIFLYPRLSLCLILDVING